jgi:hypothetical protein
MLLSCSLAILTNLAGDVDCDLKSDLGSAISVVGMSFDDKCQ